MMNTNLDLDLNLAAF